MNSLPFFRQVLHDIIMLFIDFASCTGYEDDIVEVISNFTVQGSKFDVKFDKFVKKSF